MEVKPKLKRRRPANRFVAGAHDATVRWLRARLAQVQLDDCAPPKPRFFWLRAGFVKRLDDFAVVGCEVAILRTDGRVQVGTVVRVTMRQIELRLWGCHGPPERIPIAGIDGGRLVPAHSWAEARLIRTRQVAGLPAQNNTGAKAK